MTEPKPPATAPTVGEMLRDNSNEGIPLALRAAALREAAVVRFREESMATGLARDDASRDASSYDQEAKAAEAQVTAQEKEIKTLNAEITRARTRLAKGENANRDGDFEPVREDLEAIRLLEIRLENAMTRRDRAADEAIGLREDASEAKATVTRLDGDLKAASERVAQADRLLDPMEARANLLRDSSSEENLSLEYAKEAEKLRAEGKTAEADHMETSAEISSLRSFELAEKASRIIVNSRGITELEAELLPTSPDLRATLRQSMLPAVKVDPSPPTPSEALPVPTASPGLVDDDLIAPGSPTEPAPIAPSAPDSATTSDASETPDDLQPAGADSFTPKPVVADEAFVSSAERQLELDEPDVSFPEAPDPIVTDLDTPLPSWTSDEEFDFADNSTSSGSDDDPAESTDNDLL